jgi:hypothetical protein
VNKKRGGMMLVSVGLLMAVIAGWLAYSQLKAAEKRVEQVPGVRVVVATQDLPAQGRIALNSVTYATISEESLPARPITDVSQAVGQFARQRLFKGDILTADRVVNLDQVRNGTGGAAGSPSLVLDRDQVMMVLPSKMTGNFAGQNPNLLTTTNAVREGDYVDVLVTTLELPEGMSQQEKDTARRDNPWDYLRTRVMFQNLRVYHIGAWPDAQPAPAARTPSNGVAVAAQAPVPTTVRPDDRYLTFVVDRETALGLKWLKDIVALGQANVDFVLRSPTNQDVQKTEPLTVQDIRRQYGVYSGR